MLHPEGRRLIRERIAEMRLEFPHQAWKVFDNESPTVIGFDDARNATVAASCGDWILWMDADETTMGGGNPYLPQQGNAIFNRLNDNFTRNTLPAIASRQLVLSQTTTAATVIGES